MSQTEDKSKELAEDVASLVRVRNRFSRSSDQKLSAIIPALIPKLFKRLEYYRTLVIMVDNGNENNAQDASLDISLLPFLEEARGNINGIISNAMERLRGNGSMPTEPVVRAMLPYIDSDNPVVRTWALAFLKISIQRIRLENCSFCTSIIPPLLESLGQLHEKLTESEESSNTDSSLEAQWASISWLLLDIIVLLSGQKPMINWDIETFDITQTTRGMRPNDDDGMAIELHYRPSAVNFRECTENAMAISQLAAQGYFSLLLDLLTFWTGLSPRYNNTTLSPLGMRRMEHRNNSLLPPFIGQHEYALPPQFQHNRLRRRQHEHVRLPQFQHARLGRRKDWSDNSKIYLRYVKLACLEFVTSQTNRGLLQEPNKEYTVLICILFADHDSMHGRIAASYLKKWSAENSLLPFSVATSILALIIGEKQAREVLDSFEKQNEDTFFDRLFGPKCNNRNIQRLAIDWPTSLRAGNFLIENSLKKNSSTSPISIDIPNNDGNIRYESCMALLVGLSLKLSEANDDEHKYLAIQLVSNFFCHLQRPKKSMILKVFDLIFSVLTILANSSIGEDLRILPHRNVQTLAGIPRPFRNRNDLNYRLQSHRQSLKRKNLSRDNAVSARKCIYELIPLLTPYIFKRSDASHFQLPILLLRCIVVEEECLENCLIKALDSILDEYEKKIHKDQSLICKGGQSDGASLQQQAIFILPALLEAVCSDSVNVRINAIKWIQKLLVNMDAEAASYLAAHLVHDQNQTIAKMAKATLESTKTNLSSVIDRESFFVSIIDLNRSDGLRKVQSDLKNRCKMLAQRLQISNEESMVLLLLFKFSVTRAELKFRTNPAACRELCGLVFEKKTKMNEDKGDYVDCGICYEEVEVRNTYHLQCGHRFCKTCWISYITDASNETSLVNFLDLRCPYHRCSTRVMISDLQRLEPCLIPKWNNAIVRNFIEEDASYRYCSGPDCGCVAMRLCQSTTIAPHLLKVKCNTCSTSFCFGCGQNAHSPASCSDIAKWNLLKGSSQFWMKQNSKPCPGCNAPIEKNTGCNHMHCSNCNTDFCWLCLTLLNSHLEPHTCIRYDSADSAENNFERQAMFTTTRYEAHDAAANFTLNQFKSFDPHKWLETYWFLDEDEDPEIMTQALKTLLDGRDFLKNSYVAMLGLAEDTKRLKLHNNHHECLEMFTEKLSHLTETNLRRQYELHGHVGIRIHFRKLAFYTTSVAKYMERMELFVDTQP